jgi:hypothetical protein
MIDREASEKVHVELPYAPRPYFMPLHNSTKRWKFVVAHRRCGKTVALVNQLIRAALNNNRKTPFPRYAYVGASFDAAKDLIWTYLKQFTETIKGIRFLEGELTVIFPKGATIKLYGGALAYERMRGLFFDGIVMDEFAMLHPQAFTSVVRPALGDYLGWAVISGTPAGQDHFYQLKLRAESDPSWDVFEIPISATGSIALAPEEVEEMRKDMSPDEFQREMMCSFDSPVEGAYYAEALNALQLAGRVASVPIDLNADVFTGWDLGISDAQCIWFGQIVGREYHFVDYLEGQGQRLSFYATELSKRAKTSNYSYRAHLLPHDVESRELMTGHSRRQELVGLLDAPVITVPRHDPADGIVAARGILGLSWFDEAKTRRGLARLRSYRRGKTGMPVHDDASHGADAFRTAAVGIPLISSSQSAKWGATGRLRRKLRGLI